MLQDLKFGQSYFSFQDMYANRAIKKEERKACLFDLDDFVNFPGDFPSAIVKSEHLPPICRLPTPYSQPYPFAAARPGSFQDPYLYRKFISLSLLVILCSNCLEKMLGFLIYVHVNTTLALAESLQNCFPLFSSATFCHTSFILFFATKKITCGFPIFRRKM